MEQKLIELTRKLRLREREERKEERGAEEKMDRVTAMLLRMCMEALPIFITDKFLLES